MTARKLLLAEHLRALVREMDESLREIGQKNFRFGTAEGRLPAMPPLLIASCTAISSICWTASIDRMSVSHSSTSPI